MFLTHHFGEGDWLAGRGVSAPALPRTRRHRVCSVDKRGLFQRFVHSGGSPGVTAPPLRPAEVFAERGQPSPVARGVRARKRKGVPAHDD